MSNDIIRISCVNESCGTFPMDRALRDRLKRTGGTFTCPAGHQQHFTESREQELQNKIDELERKVERLENREESLWETLDERHKQLQQQRERRRIAEKELLDDANGVVEIGEEWMWACRCGGRGNKRFESKEEAKEGLQRHREQTCEFYGEEPEAVEA